AAADADTPNRIGGSNHNNASEVGAEVFALALSAASRPPYMKGSVGNYDADAKAQDPPSASRGRLPAGGGGAAEVIAVAAAAVKTTEGIASTGGMVRNNNVYKVNAARPHSCGSSPSTAVLTMATPTATLTGQSTATTTVTTTSGGGSVAAAAVAAQGSPAEIEITGTDGSTAVRIAAGLRRAPSNSRAPVPFVKMGMTDGTLTSAPPPAAADGFTGVSSSAGLGCEQQYYQAPGFGVREHVSQNSVSATGEGARILPLNQRPPSRSTRIDGDDADAGPERPGLGLGGAGGDAFPMQLLFRGLRLRWGIAAGPLKGGLAVGDLSGHVSYKGKAFAQAAKLASKAKSGQICVTMDFARALPSFLLDELTIIEKA
ncbi:hypothetical protein Vretimale_8570, partial [Volvox reticuliferus]